NMPKQWILWMLGCVFAAGAHAQMPDPSTEEKKLLVLGEKTRNFYPPDFDSVSYFSEQFDSVFYALVQQNPATLQYPFSALTDSGVCWVTTAADGNFRIYSWDTWTGGTMHFFHSIWQWKSNGSVHAKLPQLEEGDPASYCTAIDTVHIQNQTYYLAITNRIGSTKIGAQAIGAFAMEGDQLNDTVPMFRNKTETLNALEIAFDFFDVVDRPERPVKMIHYDPRAHTVDVAVVDEEGHVKPGNERYQLRGRYFERAGVKQKKKE
ncbi:MAG: hypothetical protein U0T73_07085, partial [Chitinophagales bacterium]